MSKSKYSPIEQAAKTLKMWAWIVFWINILGSAIIALKFAWVRNPEYEYAYITMFNPSGFFLALALFISGLLAFSVLSALSAMANEIGEIGRKLAIRPREESPV